MPSPSVRLTLPANPLAELHLRGQAVMAQYGPDEGEGRGGAIPIVQAFDPVPIEYASVRTHAGLFDAPHRATLELTGADRVAFLNRMLTQELKDAVGEGAAAFIQRRAFWLNRKGRIDADLRVIVLPERVLLDVDVFAAERARAGLEAFVIADDVTIRDVSAAFHRLSLHGPAAAAILARASTPVAGASVADIRPGQVAVVTIAGAQVVVDRHDWTGQTGGAAGLELLVPATACVAVYEAISTPWSARDGDGQRDGRGGVTPGTALARRIGWHALNIARIEAGEPLYLTDFGPDSLPAETGERTLNDRVSFKKGCYLGQEVVARMHALGHPKQQLVGLNIRDVRLTPHAGVSDAGARSDAYTPQAVTGTPVLAADAPDAPVVGAVTSSCVSPLLGSSGIALAMVKWSSSTPGTVVFLGVDGARLPATVAPPGPLVA